MSYSLFVTFDGDHGNDGDLQEWLAGPVQAKLGTMSKGLRVEHYRPAVGKSALFDDGPGPAAMIEVITDDITTIARLVRKSGFKDLLTGEASVAVQQMSVSFGLFESFQTPIATTGRTVERTAPLSFVVRYFGPIPDENAFVDFYTANHPPLLARFPGIRNVLCYIDCGADILRGTDLPVSEVRFGNEVVFDDLDTLNNALQSEIMPQLKADSRNFPAFGYSTHHAMQRTRLI